MSDKKSNRIPAEQLTAYERWELPAMEPGGNDVIRSQVSSAEIPVKPLTAADLESIRQEAYQAGFDQGKEEGTAAGHKEGFEKGFQEGLEDGKQKGLQEGTLAGQQSKQVEIDEHNARLKTVMEQLLDPIRLHDDEIETALLNLVLAISRAVIMRELSLDSQQVSNVLSDALASLPTTSSNVKVWINSVDFERVSGVVESIANDVQIIKSDEILPGGCKVETLHSQIDATVEKRFQKTVQEMLDRHSSSLPADESPDLTESMEDMTDFHRDVLEDVEKLEDIPSPAETLSVESPATAPDSVSAVDSLVADDALAEADLEAKADLNAKAGLEAKLDLDEPESPDTQFNNDLDSKSPPNDNNISDDANEPVRKD